MVSLLAIPGGVKTLAIAGGAVVLLLGSTYGLGYWKGSRARAAAPVTTVKDTEGAKREDEKRVSVSNIYGEEDIVEKRLTLPELVFADGSRETTTKISRQVASKETAATEAKVEVVYKDRVVTKEVTVPCPAAANTLVSPFPAPAPPQPRFMAGPTVGRNFKLDRTVFGGGAAVRVGPVWLRVAGDSDPSASVGAEVSF